MWKQYDILKDLGSWQSFKFSFKCSLLSYCKYRVMIIIIVQIKSVVLLGLILFSKI